MRKENSKFITKFISEAGTQLVNRDYYGYVELDQFACYVLADSLDEDKNENSAQIVVDSIIHNFNQNPSMSARDLRGYIKAANRDLKSEQSGMRLKASVMLVVTDYSKIRYASVGNTRFYLFRDDRFIHKSKDQSLTRYLLDEEEIEQDKVALHEERNNLYSYLGQEKALDIYMSKKIKLQDGDSFQMFTKGIWEYCDDGELLDICQDVSTPDELLDDAEEIILSKQPKEIDNYTLVVTFVDKTYRNPKKKWTLKKVLMIIIPVLVIIIAISIVLIVRYRSIQTKKKNLESYQTSGEAFLSSNNYIKALEEYKEALKLAKSLKKTEKSEELDQYIKLIEEIILGDEQLQDEDYSTAYDTYTEALNMSYDLGNVSEEYIEKKLEKTIKCMEIFDWISIGEEREKNDDLDGARDAYEEARSIALALYDNSAREEVMSKITAIDTAVESMENESESVKQSQEDESKAAEESEQAESKEKKESEEAESKAAKESEQAESKEKKESEEAESKAARESQEAESKAVKESEQEMSRSIAESVMSSMEKELAQQSKEQENKNQLQQTMLSNAIQFENNGDTLFSEGNLNTALSYYKASISIYKNLEFADNVSAVEAKINEVYAALE